MTNEAELRSKLESLSTEQLVSMAKATLQLREQEDESPFMAAELQEQQRPVFTSDKQSIYVFGGNQSGKSFIGALFTVIMSTGIVPKKIQKYWHRKIKIPSNGWVCGIDFPTMSDSIQKKILDMIPGNMRKKWDERTHVYTLTNGSKISFKSYDAGVLTFQGATLDYAEMDEEPPRDIHEETKIRLLKHNGVLLVTETPTQGITWSHDEIYLKEFELPDTAIFFLDSEKNPHLSKEAIEKLKKTVSKDELEMRLRGKFLSKTGVIYSIDPEINVVPYFPPPKDWNRFRGIDPGIGHPTGCGWFAVDPMNRHYLYREYLRPDLNVKNNAAEILKLSKYSDGKYEDILTSIMDPNSGGSRTYTSEKTVQTEYLENGIPSVLGNDDVDVGIDVVRQNLMSLADGKSRLIIMDNCVNTLKTMRGYVWGAKKMNGIIYGTGKPKKINDELPDVVRYYSCYNPIYISPSQLAYRETGERDVVNQTTGY